MQKGQDSKPVGYLLPGCLSTKVLKQKYSKSLFPSWIVNFKRILRLFQLFSTAGLTF